MPNVSERLELQIAPGERKKYDIDRYRAPFELGSDTFALLGCGVAECAAGRKRDQDCVEADQPDRLRDDECQDDEDPREVTANHS